MRLGGEVSPSPTPTGRPFSSDSKGPNVRRADVAQIGTREPFRAGAIAAVTFVAGLGARLAPISADRAPIVKPTSRVRAGRVRSGHSVDCSRSVIGTLDASAEAIAAGGVVAVVHGNESAIAFFDGRSGKRLAGARRRLILAGHGVRRSRSCRRTQDAGLSRPSARVRRSGDAKGRSDPVDSALPRGVWSGLAWDSVRRRAIVTGLDSRDRRSRADQRTIHEFDERGVEVALYREMPPVAHRLQASFNMPFATVDGPIVLSGSESLERDRRVRPLVVEGAPGSRPPTIGSDRSIGSCRLKRWRRSLVAEPTMTWLARNNDAYRRDATVARTLHRYIHTARGRSRSVRLRAVDRPAKTHSLTQPTRTL